MKYRRKCLSQIRETVLNAFKETEKVSDFKILIMELDKDHIHLLLKWKPHFSIEQIVRRLKQMTTKHNLVAYASETLPLCASLKPTGFGLSGGGYEI